MEDEMFFNEESLIALMRSMAVQIASVGLDSVEMMTWPNLEDEQLALMMKGNLFLTVFTMLLASIGQDNDVEAAKRVVQVWSSEKVRELTKVAYADEINNLKQHIDDDIQKLENMVNGTKDAE